MELKSIIVVLASFFISGIASAQQAELESFLIANRDSRRLVVSFAKDQGGVTSVRLKGSLVCLSYNFEKYIVCDRGVRVISNQEIDSSRYFYGKSPYNQWGGYQVLYVSAAELQLNDGRRCLIDVFGYFPKRGPIKASCYDRSSRVSQLNLGSRLKIPLINKRYENDWN